MHKYNLIKAFVCLLGIAVFTICAHIEITKYKASVEIIKLKDECK